MDGAGDAALRCECEYYAARISRAGLYLEWLERGDCAEKAPHRECRVRRGVDGESLPAAEVSRRGNRLVQRRGDASFRRARNPMAAADFSDAGQTLWPAAR